MHEATHIKAKSRQNTPSVTEVSRATLQGLPLCGGRSGASGKRARFCFLVWVVLRPTSAHFVKTHQVHTYCLCPFLCVLLQLTLLQRDVDARIASEAPELSPQVGQSSRCTGGSEKSERPHRRGRGKLGRRTGSNITSLEVMGKPAPRRQRLIGNTPTVY